MDVISDSSSIIALNRIGKLDILKNLYGKIIIPKAVEQEITSDHKKRIFKELITLTLGIGVSYQFNLNLLCKRLAKIFFKLHSKISARK